MSQDTSKAISEITQNQDHSVQRMKQFQQYQQIQKELAAKRVEQEQQKPKAVQPIDVQDKVQIQSLFQWQKGSDGEFAIQAGNRIGVGENPAKEMKYSGEKILRLLGYKIDLSERVESLKENYSKLYIECKSTNVLMAKFSQIKLGMLTMLLSVFGVTTEELQKLQKKALSNSVEENVSLFEQNEYNTEMLLLFSANAKKDKRKVKMLDEVRNQLMEQMKLLGQDSFYTQEKILTIKKNQVLKIEEDLIKEKQNLEYLRDFS